MNKKPTEISPDLTIPGFDVTVHNPHSCQVRSQDGRHQFSVEIDESREYPLIISGNSVSEPWRFRLGAWEWRGLEYTTDADDAITQVANSLKLMDKLSSEGFSAKIDGGALVLSHPSKPDYNLRMSLADARKIVLLKNTSLYTWVKYCGPAYDSDFNTKSQLDIYKWKLQLDSYKWKLIVTNKGLEELAQEFKARILSLGEKDPGIAQWVKGEIESALAPQGFTFTPKPKKGIVEFSHPTGLSGTLSFAPFTVGRFDFHPKYPNPQFPTDIGTEKVVLFTLDRRNYREPYTKGFLEKNPQEVIHEFRRFLALPLVYQEVCKAWKSDILVPKLNGNSLQLVNTKIEGDDSIVLELTVEKEEEKDKLALKNKDKKDYYEISDDPGEIAQTIASLAEKHVQEFIQENGIKLTNTRVVEIDF
jgi:hypothetical protein